METSNIHWHVHSPAHYGVNFWLFHFTLSKLTSQKKYFDKIYFLIYIILFNCLTHK